ncbi:ABC transporter substrate-binding protein [Clostridium sp. KNHs216]|uniref:ABC transporter substrate-binding protein n=1 Tax=Eubacteriales TaxID=186802 RepID=UPI001154903E|nr:ABC transporter substrate-binding protein [Clostridium sp. KNHs216]MBE6830081.1 ABC transporter substrate-binding protein [Oscillospiraceae bacterium]TQI69067.1 branched-chain amino acid transport system substrate-binding protein [Clostridium sp. KNHs216]
MKRIAALLLALIMTATAFSGCKKVDTASGSAATGSDTIKIGVFEPLTGANAAGGEAEVEGIKIANKLYPEVLGKKVEIVVADNKSDKAQATTAVARLIEKDKVSAIIGSWGSSFSMAAGDLVKKNKVPAVGASCTNPLVTKGNDYYFRVCYLDPFQGTVMANYAFKSGAKKAAIVQEVSNDYAVGLATYFKEAFIKLTGDPNSVVTTVNYNTNDQEFGAQLSTVKAANPDVIFAPGNFTESALVMKQARQLGITAPFLGGDTWDIDEFTSVGGTDVEGATISTFFDDSAPVTEEGKKFVEAYKKEYPDKNMAAVSALGYDAYLVIIKAIEAANSSDSTAIRDALAKTKDVEGATGKLTFNEDGDPDKDSAIIKEVKNGKFTYKDTVTISK